MKRIRFISLIIALLSVMGIMPVTAQQESQYALYNYRNDGDFNAWLNIDVDSITYSNIGLDSVEYDNIVTQEVWTPDSCYRIPIEVIDSIGFKAPKPEFKEGIFHITNEHLPYAVDVDSLVVIFASSIPSSMLPAVGQIVISDVYDDPFEDGFAGRVESVEIVKGKYVVQCSEVKITDIFSKLILVGKGVSVIGDEPANKTRRKSWWEDPAFTIEDQGIYPVKLPTTLDLTLLSGVCSVKSKNPELIISYYLYLDDVIYSFSADAYLNHKDLSFQIAFKLSDFMKIGNTLSEHMTNFILGKGDKEKTEEKWYEHEFDDIKLKIPFQAGLVNFTVELAPIFKLDGDVEIDVINKTSARQHLGFKSSGYTATLLANPFLPLALGDLNYNYVQDPTRVQQLTMKAEGSATMGLSLQLKANVISKNLLHAAIGAEYDRKASATLQFNLYDTENPISGLYDVIKDSKVKIEDYVKIKGEIGVSPLKVLTLKGSFKIPVKTWGEYYMVPHFSKPELPPYKNNPWNFSKPLSLYSAVSKDILLGCKPGLRIEDSNGNYVKQYTSTDEYKYEDAWVHTPLEIDISDLTPNKTYRCYPTFSMLGLDPFVVTPFNEFTIPQNLSVSPQSISMPVGMEYIIEIRDGWDNFAVVMEDGEDVVSILNDEETDARHIKVKGKKEGNASLKIEDRRSGQVVHVPITVSNGVIPVTSIILSDTSLTIQPGGTRTITATVLPENATNKSVTWKSNKNDVATVNENGVVTAVAEGTCTIRCYATDGSGIKKDCSVTVSNDFIPVTSITLSDTSLTLQPGGTRTITATVLPENATNKTVTWKSNKNDVATVDSNGVVTAVAEGTCTIRCYATDGSGIKTDCSVTVTSGTIPDTGNHEYVDLGLPSGLLWATCNVGASKPEEYGDYFAWGETKPKSDYSYSTYKWGSDYNQLTKYCTKSSYGLNGFTDNKTTLDLADDAARANWGGQWRMPTSADFSELLSNTSNQWVTNYNGTGVNGRLFTASNGNTLFLPAAGWRYDESLDYAGSYGYYWSSSLSAGYPDSAYYLGFGSGSVDVYDYYGDRYDGHAVRPVRPKN